MKFKLETPEHQRTAMRRVVEVHLYPSFGLDKELAGSSHTSASCLSKPRSSLEAGKKQIRVWLQYFCSGAKVLLLYSSFSVGFKPTFLTLGRANAFVLHSFNRKVPLVLLRFPYDDSEKARNGLEEGSKMYGFK